MDFKSFREPEHINHPLTRGETTVRPCYRITVESAVTLWTRGQLVVRTMALWAQTE